MSWRDRLQQAKFRGVSFFVQQAQGSGGRRLVVHEFPEQDHHYPEDLGKKAGTYQLTAFLIGADYDLARDQFIKALDKSGAGTLVHPYLGTMQIQIQEYTWTISTARGGYCLFNITYIKSGRQPAKATASSAAALKSAVNSADENTIQAFADKFSVAGQSAHVTAAANNYLQQATDTIRTVNGKINNAVGTVQGIASDIAALSDEITTLVTAPATLISSMAGVISTVVGAFNNINSAFTAYENLLAGFTLTSTVSRTSANGTETGTRIAMADNEQAINTALTTLATTSLVSFIAGSDGVFDSYDDAVMIRDALQMQIDALAENETLSYAEYNALKDLATALFNRVEDIAPGLSKIEYIQRQVSLPAVVIAHQVYGDASRADELTERNRISNPLFMPAGKDIEVLV